jgi:hypothetical protein
VKTTPETIAELKRLLAEATPLPWESHPMPGVKTVRNVCTMHFDSSRSDLPLIVSGLNALPSLLADLEAARKREQVLRHELTRLRDVVSAVEYDSIDAALADTEVKPCDSKLNVAAHNALPSLLADIELLREALQAVSQKHPGYGGTGDIARKALAATEVKP